MRQISFAMTTRQIVNQTKTVTRRTGWVRLQPGTLLQPIEKGQGIPKGGHVTCIGAAIRVVSVRRERLSLMRDDVDYGLVECAREGFGPEPVKPWLSLFVDYFAASHHCDVDDDITRIEFEYTVTLAQAQVAFMQQHAPHLHRRAGEELQREPSDDPRLDCLTCGGCGEMTLVQATGWYLRELSTNDATAALSRAFDQRLGQVSR